MRIKALSTTSDVLKYEIVMRVEDIDSISTGVRGENCFIYTVSGKIIMIAREEYERISREVFNTEPSPPLNV
jgi:hypothetical protein